MVASQVDAVVLTVSRGEQSQFVGASISHLVSVGAKIAGLVFNRAKTVDVLKYSSSGLASSTTSSSACNRRNVRACALDREAIWANCTCRSLSCPCSQEQSEIFLASICDFSNDESSMYV